MVGIAAKTKCFDNIKGKSNINLFYKVRFIGIFSVENILIGISGIKKVKSSNRT